VRLKILYLWRLPRCIYDDVRTVFHKPLGVLPHIQD
jgi:hypothetical protein